LPWTLAVDGSFLYIAGPQKCPPPTRQWRIEKRDKGTGSSSRASASTGGSDENPTSDRRRLLQHRDRSDVEWLVAPRTPHARRPPNGRIRIEKRKLLDGALEAVSGTGGVVTVDAAPATITERTRSARHVHYVFSRVETALAPGLQRRIEKRDLATGASGRVVYGSASIPSGELPSATSRSDEATVFVCQADGSPDARWSLERRFVPSSRSSSSSALGRRAINPAVGDTTAPRHRGRGRLYSRGRNGLGRLGRAVAHEARWR
jgi:hypothetical protein